MGTSCIMMDTTTHPHVHLNWPEFLEMGVFLFLFLIAMLLLIRCITTPNSRTKINIHQSHHLLKKVPSWKEEPEIQLIMLATPLQLLWEIAQFPLYTIWHEGDWSYIFYGLIHCTIGDLMITLSVFWLVSLLNRSRRWIFSSTIPNIILFTALGLTYTIFSEIVNTRIKGTWGYTELMPIVPVIEIGGMPFLQWLLIPPVLIWLIYLIRPVKQDE